MCFSFQISVIQQIKSKPAKLQTNWIVDMFSVIIIAEGKSYMEYKHTTHFYISEGFSHCMTHSELGWDCVSKGFGVTTPELQYESGFITKSNRKVSMLRQAGAWLLTWSVLTFDKIRRRCNTNNSLDQIQAVIYSETSVVQLCYFIL